MPIEETFWKSQMSCGSMVRGEIVLRHEVCRLSSTVLVGRRCAAWGENSFVWVIRDLVARRQAAFQCRFAAEKSEAGASGQCVPRVDPWNEGNTATQDAATRRFIRRLVGYECDMPGWPQFCLLK